MQLSVKGKTVGMNSRSGAAKGWGQARGGNDLTTKEQQKEIWGGAGTLLYLNIVMTLYICPNLQNCTTSKILFYVLKYI